MFNKFIYFYLFLFICNVSCNKSNDTSANSTQSVYIKFKLNGAQYQFNGGYSSVTSTGEGVYGLKILASTILSKTIYEIQGQSGNNRVINLVIVSDSLKSQSYNTPTISSNNFYPSLVNIDGKLYGTFQASDVISITINRYSVGTIDGNFSGNLSQSLSNGTQFLNGSITEGEFKNVKIIY